MVSTTECIGVPTKEEKNTMVLFLILAEFLWKDQLFSPSDGNLLIQSSFPSFAAKFYLLSASTATSYHSLKSGEKPQWVCHKLQGDWAQQRGIHGWKCQLVVGQGKVAEIANRCWLSRDINTIGESNVGDGMGFYSGPPPTTLTVCAPSMI